MSETDDTDILVRIPSNFFHVQSSPSDDSYNIDSTRTVVRRGPKTKFEAIDDLVTQVGNLESRIENLEITSNSTHDCSVAKSVQESYFIHSLTPRRLYDSTDFDHSSHSKQESKCYTFPRRKRRKQIKKSSKAFNDSRTSTLCDSFNYKQDNLNDYYTIIPNATTGHSFKSASELNLKLRSLNSDESRTMEGDMSSISSSPEKKTDKYVLKEIDIFLDKVDMYESSVSMQNSRDAEPSHARTSGSASATFCEKLKQEIFNLENNEVKLPSGRMISREFLDKYHLNENNNQDIEKAEQFHYVEKIYETNPQKILSDSNVCQQTRSTPTKDSFKVPFRTEESQSHVNRKLDFIESTGMKFHPTSTPKQPLPNEVMKNSLNGPSSSFNPSCSRLSERASNMIENKKSLCAPSVNHFLQSDVSIQNETPDEKEKSSKCINRDATNSCSMYVNRLSSVQEGRKSTLHQDSAKTSMRKVFPIPATNLNKQPRTVKSMNINQIYGNFDESQVSSFDTRGIECPDINLISLSDLWATHDDGDVHFKNQKFEEEKLKREHCEDIIQQLQKKLLEQQEKLAVAVRVDAAKDTAVGKLRASWLRIQQRLNETEGRHKGMLERMTDQINNLKTKTTESEQKTKQYEDELHKALDLAHGYQEKYKEVSEQRSSEQQQYNQHLAQLQEHNESKRKEFEDLRENNAAVIRLNKQFTDCIQKLEDTIEKEKNVYERTKVQMSTLNTTVECMKNEMSVVLCERDTLTEKVRQEQARSTGLTHQLAEMQERYAVTRKREESFETEMCTLRKQIEVQKNDLKTYYQKQLEEAVLEKLAEFQNQLDIAQRQMELEMKDKEVNIAEGFARRLYKMEEQHKLEISLLEQKQAEESKLRRLHLAQAAHKIHTLENKLESFRSRRGQIASQLHHVMESQWRQALHILTSQGTSSSSSPPTPDISAFLAGSDHKMGNFPNMDNNNGYSQSKAVVQEQEQEQAQREGASPIQQTDTCVESLLTDAQLQHYVKMLLSKPANLSDGSSESVRPQHRRPVATVERNTDDTTGPHRDTHHTKSPPPNYSRYKSDDYSDRHQMYTVPEQPSQPTPVHHSYTEQSRTNYQHGTAHRDKVKDQHMPRDSNNYNTDKPPWKC